MLQIQEVPKIGGAEIAKSQKSVKFSDANSIFEIDENGDFSQSELNPRQSDDSLQAEIKALIMKKKGGNLTEEVW